MQTQGTEVCVVGLFARLPCGSWLDVTWVGAARAGGLSLAGQEGLTRAGVGESVFSRLFLHRHALGKKKKMIGEAKSILKYLKMYD